MRLRAPRIAAVSDTAMDDAQRAVLAPMLERGTAYNVFRTMAAKPKALERFLGWASYILSRHNSLSERDRELVILRTGHNCRAGYEWAQHAAIGKRAGLSDDELERIKAGPADPAWPPRDTAMLAACDDLTGDFFVSETNWAKLMAHFSEEQCMDLVYTVGQYTQVSMLLNSFGVQLDAGLSLDPDLDGRRE